MNRAVDEILLGDKRVSSAAEGRRLFARNEQTESRADDIRRIIVLAVPIIRALARGARVVKLPWVIVGSTAVAVGVAVPWARSRSNCCPRWWRTARAA